MQEALTDDPRPKPPKRLDTRQQAAIVAMVCGPPPPGYARWTIRVTTAETQRRGIVADVGRETVQYVSNIFKYYVAYKLTLERASAREEAKPDAAPAGPAKAAT